MSQHLRKLEAILGARLVVRAAGGCTLTPEGADFLPYAESLLRLNERATGLFRERRIAIGASSNIGTYLLQPYIRSYLAHTGECQPVDVQIHRNPVIAQKLESGEIDVAAMEWWDDRPGCVARPWRREQLVVIVPPGHPWTTLSNLPPALLRGAPILGGEPGTGTGRLLADRFGAWADNIRVVRHLGSTEAVKQWVRAGLGVSLVLAGTVAQECREGWLHAIPIEGEPLCKEFYVVWRDSLHTDSPPRRFAEWLSAQPAPVGGSAIGSPG